MSLVLVLLLFFLTVSIGVTSAISVWEAAQRERTEQTAREGIPRKGRKEGSSRLRPSEVEEQEWS